ncbi:hypothetical protein DERA104750_15025 [Deinococcus radiodurans]
MKAVFRLRHTGHGTRQQEVIVSQRDGTALTAFFQVPIS